jgi:hypothetical protein
MANLTKVRDAKPRVPLTEGKVVTSRFTYALVLYACLLSSCGGGGGGLGCVVSGGTSGTCSDLSLPPPPPPPTNAGGVWEGSTFIDQSGLAFETIGVVTENNGEARFVNEQGQQFILSGVSGTGGNISATITAISPIGFTFIDGSTVTTGTLTGTLVERGSLDGNWSLNTGETGTITMSYNNLYDRGSDLARMLGTWEDSFGVVYSVDAVGDIFAQDAFGCVYDGAVTIINASYNAYQVALTVSNCPGVDGNYSGLGVLSDDVGTDDAFVVQLDNSQLIITDVLLKL